MSAAPARPALRTPGNCWTRCSMVFGKIGRERGGQHERSGPASSGHEREGDEVIDIEAGIGWWRNAEKVRSMRPVFNEQYDAW